MMYKQLSPIPSLKDYLRCYWWLDNTTNKDLNYSIFPDGCFDYIIYFDNYQQTRITLTGLWSKETQVIIPSNTQLFGIQFRLPAVEFICKKSIASFLNGEIELEENYWQLSTIKFQETFLLIEKLNQRFLTSISAHQDLDTRKQKLFKLLNQTKGNQTVAFYAEQVYWSSRQINRYFKGQFGLSLKEYCNILKCISSFKYLKKGQLFPQQNYFDRPHFIKEVKKHTNNTPKELFKNENDRFLQLSIIPKP